MFCVIQEIETKKPNKNGYAKEIETSHCGYKDNSGEVIWNTHHYGHVRFERPIKKAYRISIHHSYRENGKVKKKQFVLCTANYYEFATDTFSLYDWCDSRIQRIAIELSADVGEIYDMVQTKISVLESKIQAEFSETEEYKVHEEHERITTEYALKKVQFNQKYEVDGHEYDICYDVFGNLTNPEYLEKIKREYKQRKEYEEKSRSYQEDFWSNYSKHFGGGGSSYHNSVSDNHTEDDKETLKQFYRALSKKFHPDANPDIDTSKEMQLLNRLKSEWGV